MSDEGESKQTRPGPEPERLKIDSENWREALREALRRTDEEKDETGEEGPDV